MNCTLIRECLEDRFSFVGQFNEGLVRVQNNGLWFHVDKYGNPAYERRFSFVGDFRNNVAIARNRGNTFKINRDGTTVEKHKE